MSKCKLIDALLVLFERFFSLHMPVLYVTTIVCVYSQMLCVYISFARIVDKIIQF